MLQGDMAAPIMGTAQHGMAVEEGAPPRILTTQAHRVTLGQETRVGHGFGKTPIQGFLAVGHLEPVGHDARHTGMQVHPGGHLQHVGGPCLELFCRHGAFHGCGIVLMTEIGRPVHLSGLGGYLGLQGSCGVFAPVQGLAVEVHHALCLIGGNDPFLVQALGI